MTTTPPTQTPPPTNETGPRAEKTPSTHFSARRTRLQVQGDFAKSFSYFLQFDNPNFGKYGNFNNRLYVQDAWFALAPTGITGGTVFYVEAGIIFVPVARDPLTTIPNNPTLDGHPHTSPGRTTG